MKKKINDNENEAFQDDTLFSGHSTMNFNIIYDNQNDDEDDLNDTIERQLLNTSKHKELNISSKRKEPSIKVSNNIINSLKKSDTKIRKQKTIVQKSSQTTKLEVLSQTTRERDKEKKKNTNISQPKVKHIRIDSNIQGLIKEEDLAGDRELERDLNILEKRVDELIKINEKMANRLDLIESKFDKRSTSSKKRTSILDSINDEDINDTTIALKVHKIMADSITCEDTQTTKNSFQSSLISLINKFNEKERKFYENKIENLVKDMDNRFNQASREMNNNFDEFNTVNKIELQHIHNQIKKCEENVNEILMLIETNSINSLKSVDINNMVLSNLEEKTENNIIDLVKHSVKDSNEVNNKLTRFLGTSSISHTSTTSSAFVLFNLCSQEFIKKSEEIIKKYSKTEKLLDETLKQLNTMKKNNISFKDNVTKDYTSCINIIKEIKEFKQNEEKTVVNYQKEIEKISEHIIVINQMLSKNKNTTSIEIEKNFEKIWKDFNTLFKEINEIKEKKSDESKNYNNLKEVFGDYMKNYKEFSTKIDGNFLIKLILKHCGIHLVYYLIRLIVK